MSSTPLGGTEGMSEARDAFNAAMDAESPSRSVKAKDKRPDERMDIDDLFPQRRMDRRESEGGADTDPDIVRQRRAEAGNPNFGEIEDRPPPRDPTEGNDEDYEDTDGGLIEDEGQPEPQEEEGPEEDGERIPLDLNAVVEVTVDGKPVEVTLQEALKGYIRQETFHQRLNEVAAASQQIQMMRNEMAAYQQAFVERATTLESYIGEFMPEEPDWEALYAQDGPQAHLYKLRWDKFVSKVNGLIERRAQTQAEIARAYQENLTHFANANRHKIASMHPEWKSEKIWKRDHDSMRRTARHVGYSDAEINQLYDARGVEILHMAAQWMRLMASKPKPVAQQVGHPSRRNGSTPSRNLTRSLERAEKRLSRTGSLNDAAAVFESILDRER